MKLSLVVNNENPAPLIIRDAFDPMHRLSSEQQITVTHTLREWRKEYVQGRVKINATRRTDGAIPTWADWSGCLWVERHASTYRSQMFSRLSRMHITLFMHLALPPFWLADDEAEQECKRKYGYWSDELKWIPPEIINGTTVWLPR